MEYTRRSVLASLTGLVTIAGCTDVDDDPCDEIETPSASFNFWELDDGHVELRLNTGDELNADEVFVSYTRENGDSEREPFTNAETIQQGDEMKSTYPVDTDQTVRVLWTDGECAGTLAEF